MFRLLLSKGEGRKFYFSLIWVVLFPLTSWAQEMPCQQKIPFEAPPHPAMEDQEKESKFHLVDNGDGTITDNISNLLWAQKDSYADLGRCLNYDESFDYVKQLRTGGYTDWRIPTIQELASIYDSTQSNVMAWDHDPENPLALDSKFADGAAYWYWSSETGTRPMTLHCAKTFYFPRGIIEVRRFELCNNGGVRAVRDLSK